MSRQIKTQHPRSLAALVCDAVIHEGRSLGEAIEQVLEGKNISPQDRGFIQTLSFGVVRWYWQLEEQLSPLLNKPIKKKERLIKYVLLLGIFQIQHLQTPAHAAVSDTVKCCQQLGKQWAKNLVNACLRNFLRQLDNETQTYLEPTKHFSHPQWMIEKIQTAWPEHIEDILFANNHAAPLCLRVNPKNCTRDDYLKHLQNAEIHATKDPYSSIGVRLEKSLPVQMLPKFDQGWASVQDTASQLITQFLHVSENQRVLDACAAPGGKTSLLMENSPNNILMHAVDISGERNNRLKNTLARLQLNAQIISGDASKPEKWWDQKPYQRILVDAPCSGLGVIRRHPDIKHLRKADDLIELRKSQIAILDACWQLLDNEGILLYTTCSILPEENEEQIDAFLQRTDNAKILPIEHPMALALTYGKQSLPGISDMDGFYYCLIYKQPE